MNWWPFLYEKVFPKYHAITLTILIMLYETRITEKEIIHVLKCMFMAGALTSDKLYSFVGEGSLECEAITLSCSQDDFWFVVATIQTTEALFDSLEGLETVGPLCLGTYRVEGAAHCSICMDNTAHGEWVPRLQCGHIFHDECLLRWVTGTSAMKNHCPMCRGLINDKKLMILRVHDVLLL